MRCSLLQTARVALAPLYVQSAAAPSFTPPAPYILPPISRRAVGYNKLVRAFVRTSVNLRMKRLCFFRRRIGLPPTRKTFFSILAGRTGGEDLWPLFAPFRLAQVSDSFYDVSIGAARATGRRAILLAGRKDAARLSSSVGPNEFICREAPHAELFPFASCLVHHGAIIGLAWLGSVPIGGRSACGGEREKIARGGRFGVAVCRATRKTPSRHRAAAWSEGMNMTS